MAEAWRHAVNERQFLVVRRRREGLILDLSQSVRLWQLRITTARLTVNWWFMQAAGPRASPIIPAAYVPVYCAIISETATFKAVWSKILIVNATKIHMCRFWQEIPNDRCLQRHEVNTICKDNCLFSPRALVRGIPATVHFAPENKLFYQYQII